MVPIRVSDVLIMDATVEYGLRVREKGSMYKRSNPECLLSSVFSGFRAIKCGTLNYRINVFFHGI